MNRTTTWRWLGLVLAMSLIAAGCGRDDDDSGSGDDGGSSDSTEEAKGFIDPEADCENYEPTKGITGDTILVDRGTYLGGIVVPAAKHDLTIRGVDRIGVVLDGEVVALGPHGRPRGASFAGLRS